MRLSSLFTMTIKKKLILMVGIPLLGLLGFAGNELLQQNQFSNEIGTIQEFSKFATVASGLVHELQKERGATAGFIGSKGVKFKDILPNQRKTTDEKLTAYLNFYHAFPKEDASAEFLSLTTKANQSLNDIMRLRSGVTALDVQLSTALAYYTNINADLLGAINSIIKFTPDAGMARSLTTYTNFLQSKERAGIIRAVLSNVFAKGKFEGNLFEKYSRLSTEHETYMNVFLSLASKSQKDFYSQKMQGSVVADVAKMQQIATDTGTKTALFSPLAYHMGYGQMIHNFKNYILRRNHKYFHRTEAQLNKVIQTIGQLQKNKNISSSERGHLTALTKVIQNYQAANQQAMRMVKNRKSTAAIDQRIKINDGPAIEALEALILRDMGVDSTIWFQKMTAKINLLKEVENKLSADLEKQAITLQSAIMQVYLITGFAILITLIFGFTQTRAITRLLVMLVENLQNSATQVAQASNEISSSSMTLASGASQQAAGIEETSASLNQLTGQAENNSASAHKVAIKVNEIEESVVGSLKLTEEASQIALSAGETANQGVQAMEEILISMQSIATGSDKIQDIIEVINDITHQTKILATNAAIEAARAGEQGKGFSVVADEVAHLAANSKASAKLITTLIRENTKNANEGNGLAKNGEVVLKDIYENNNRLSKIMDEVKGLSQNQALGIKEISDQVEGISIASKEQSQGVGEINKAIAQTDMVVQTNAASAEETAAASEELSAQAQMLQSLVENLSKQMGRKEPKENVSEYNTLQLPHQ